MLIIREEVNKIWVEKNMGSMKSDQTLKVDPEQLQHFHTHILKVPQPPGKSAANKMIEVESQSTDTIN